MVNVVSYNNIKKINTCTEKQAIGIIIPGLRNLLPNYLHLFPIVTEIGVAYGFFMEGIRHRHTALHYCTDANSPLLSHLKFIYHVTLVSHLFYPCDHSRYLWFRWYRRGFSIHCKIFVRFVLSAFCGKSIAWEAPLQRIILFITAQSGHVKIVRVAV